MEEQDDEIFQNYYKELLKRYKFDELKFENLSKDLSLIKKRNPFITEIGVDGGAIVDLILGYPIHDFDIRYSIYDDKIMTHSNKCLCDSIGGTIQGSEFKLLTQQNSDLGNINENGLPLSLSYKYKKGLVGNNCFTNIILFSEVGKFICPQKSFDALMNREYVPNFYGYFQYSYFGTKRKDYYDLLLEMLVRGVSYIVKRDLKCHTDFATIVELYPEIKKNVKDPEKLVKMKFSDLDTFESLLQERGRTVNSVR